MTPRYKLIKHALSHGIQGEEIASVLGVTKQRISSYMKRHKLEKKRITFPACKVCARLHEIDAKSRG